MSAPAGISVFSVACHSIGKEPKSIDIVLLNKYCPKAKPLRSLFMYVGKIVLRSISTGDRHIKNARAARPAQFSRRRLIGLFDSAPASGKSTAWPNPPAKPPAPPKQPPRLNSALPTCARFSLPSRQRHQPPWLLQRTLCAAERASPHRPRDQSRPFGSSVVRGGRTRTKPPPRRSLTGRSPNCARNAAPSFAR